MIYLSDFARKTERHDSRLRSNPEIKLELTFAFYHIAFVVLFLFGAIQEQAFAAQRDACPTGTNPRKFAILIQGFDFPASETRSDFTTLFHYEIRQWKVLLEDKLSFRPRNILWLPEASDERLTHRRTLDVDQLALRIRDFLREARPRRCDVVLLVLSGHGDKKGWLWRRSPSGMAGDRLSWAQAATAGSHGEGVTSLVDLMILTQNSGVGHAIFSVHACYSGRAIPAIVPAWNGSINLSLFTATDGDHKCSLLGMYPATRNSPNEPRTIHFGSLYFSHVRSTISELAASNAARSGGKLKPGPTEIAALFEAGHDTARSEIDTLAERKVQVCESEQIEAGGRPLSESERCKLWLRFYQNPKKSILKRKNE